jgi:CRISPR type III-B/RAMP module RAMP protein Cmr1
MGHAVPDLLGNSSEERPSICERYFGSTNTARQFRFVVREVRENEEQRLVRKTELEPRFRIKSHNPRKEWATWFFKSQPRGGEYKIVLSGREAKEKCEFFKAILTIASHFGAIGAKTQVGCGVVSVEFELDDAFKTLAGIGAIPPEAPDCATDLPSLHNLFFAEYELAAGTTEEQHQKTFLVKQAIRDCFWQNGNEFDLRHEVCGTVEDRRIGSKVCVSFPYGAGDLDAGDSPKKLLRVWGWLPADLPANTHTQTVPERIARAVAAALGLPLKRVSRVGRTPEDLRLSSGTAGGELGDGVRFGRRGSGWNGRAIGRNRGRRFERRPSAKPG